MRATRRAIMAGALSAPWIRPSRAADRTITFAGYSGIFQENYQAAVIDPFMRANPGITVTYYAMGNSAQTLGVLRAQKAAPQVDVAMLDVTVAKTGTDEGLFDPLDAAAIPALAQLSPRATFPGVAGAAMTFDNLVLLYAPQEIKPAPTSWKVLWDPAHAGQIAIPGAPDIVGIGLTLLANKVYGGGDYRQSVEAGLKAVSEMAPGVLSWDPRPDPYSFIINGQATLGIGWNARAQLYSAQSAGKLAAVLPDEGSLFQVNMVEAVRGSKQPEAARAFINYLLSPEAQAAFTERMFYAPTNTHAAIGAAALDRTAATPDRQARMMDVDWLEVAKIRERMTEQWRRRILSR